MKREHANRIRWVIEDLLPPAVRDSSAFGWLLSKAYPPVQEMADFRARAHLVTPAEFHNLYTRLDRKNYQTDNSLAILHALAEAVLPGSLADIGCGNGYTLDWLTRHNPGITHATGIDYLLNEHTRTQYPHLHFLQHDMQNLPLPDNSFDTVICTHTLEHILPITAALTELRRICARRLIIVVPREREGNYTFNPHFHFFPYAHSFLRIAAPKTPHSCRLIGRDIFYTEEKH